MQNIELAEQYVLGGMLVSKVNTSLAILELQAEDFNEPKHSLIFQAIKSVYNASNEVSLGTVTVELDRSPLNHYLTELLDVAELDPFFSQHVATVKEASIKRRLDRVGHQISELAKSPKDIEVALQESTQLISKLYSQSVNSDFSGIKDILSDCFDELSNIHANKENNTYGFIPTGFKSLDKILLGWHPSDLVVLAARPACGKTSLALDLLLKIAKQGKKTAFISLEMSARQLGLKILSAESGVGLYAMRTGLMTDSNWSSLPMDRLVKYPIKIYDDMGCGIHKLQASIRKLHATEGLDVLFIDYLQLMTGDNYRTNRVQEVSEISRSIKQLARELKITIIALSQLSREIEKRSDKRPILSDLRESGSIEQDSDIVLMLHREEQQEPDSHRKGIMDIYIRKHRNGSIGDVQLKFNGSTGSFTETDVYVPYKPKRTVDI